MKNSIPKQTKLFQKAWENKGVFSEHYIKSRLNKSLIWPKEEEAMPVWKFCRNLWKKNFLKLAKTSEAVTRQEFLDKVLTKLGFAYLPNTGLPFGKKEPDYILFADESAKDCVMGKSEMEQYKKAIALLEAKKVHHPLGKVSERETPGRFPHQQVRDYLQEATDESGKAFFNWAILTNGGKWRLYCRDAHPSDYFEFNIEDSIDSFKDFMLFFALFRRDAFIPDSEGLSSLDYLRKEALQYQAELEDNLRKRVFNILERLANGFYQRSENKIDNLDELYENCLVFLYRLLFVLYGEGRGLLPVRPYGPGSNKHYIERYSLQRLITRLKHRPDSFSSELTDLYDDILGLFHLINGDNPSRNKACKVPRYNGGLFDHKEHPKIDEWRVGEKTLADVLTGLMFSPVPAGKGEQRKFHFGETIDYADLEVRQLGSIYEGLLENHLEPEDNRLVLRGDKTKRKETGTYYTPDYIVDYIVRNTVKPICDRINETSKVKNAIEKGIKDNSFAREVLKLKILDPAMGSGHFLVRATEFLADEIVNHATTEIQTESVSKTPREEIASSGKAPVSKGLSQEEAEISYWRRRVVESCIYGVDLNPLAVELAKLSLWLTCIATDQPLSFLDHHLRPGNSLIGAKLAELGTHPRKKATKIASIPFGPDLPEAVSKAISTLKEITETESKDVSTIKDKESRWLKEVWERLKPYRTIADLWTSTFFGNKIDGPIYQTLAKLLIQNPVPRTKEAKKLQKRIKPFASSFADARKKHFFHWEFEFPEVFFNEDGTSKENRGFDAVIGNPPYVNIYKLAEEKAVIQYLSGAFPSAIKKFDLYIPFSELSYKLTKANGYHSFIVPDKWLYLPYGEKLREIFINNIIQVFDFTAIKVFKDSIVSSVVYFIKKSKAKNEKVSVRKFSSVKEYKSWRIDIKYWQRCPSIMFRLALTKERLPIIEKMLNRSIQWGEIFYVNWGCRPVPFYKYFLNKKIDPFCVPALKGEGVQRYYFDYQDTFLRYIPGELYNPMFRELFESKGIFIKDIGGNARLCGMLNDLKFYTTHTVNVSVKWKDIPNNKRGTNFKDGYLSNDIYDIYYCLAVVNSFLLSFYYWTYLSDFLHTVPNNVRQFPIRRIFFTTSQNERQRLAEELKTYVKEESISDILEVVEECLPKDKKGNFITKKEKSDVVHDFLAFLAEKMIEMNKEKQEFIMKFLEWLESEVIKGSVNSLKNKTKIKEFYKYDLKTFTDVLRQNRILPKVIGFGDKQYDKLKEAYDTTMIKLHPLINKLDNTDTLIDQIIYKLYGLSEEEIGIVEKGQKIQLR